MAVSGLLLLELLLYLSCFICGIVTAASLSIVQGQFSGRCVLFGLVSYNDSSDKVGLTSSSSASVCFFVSAVSVMVAVVGFSFALYCVYAVSIEGQLKRERAWLNFTSAVCAASLTFLLITGCVLRRGLQTLCDSITDSIANITSCDEAQFKSWLAPLKGEHFYSRLHKAEAAVWADLVLWLMVGGLLLVQRRYSWQCRDLPGGVALSARRLLADPGVTAAETEPFFKSPARPQ